MNAILTIQRNGQVLKSQPLGPGELMLGRGENCPVRLEDRAVSRQHAILRSSESGLSIERKSPLAPILVNGSECDAALLKEGDEIHIGPFILRISLPAAPSQREEPAALSEQDPQSGVDQELPSGDLVPQDVPVAPAETVAASVEAEGEPSLKLSGDFSGGGGVQSGPVEIDVSQVTSPPVEVDEDARTSMIGTKAVKLRIKVPAGLANIEESEFEQEEVSVGRGKGCDVVLNDKKASRKHAVIRRSGEGAAATYTLVDLQSANGTYVNGARVTEHVLAGDDAIRIGDVEFSVQAVSPGFANKAQRFLKVEEPLSLEDENPREVALFGADPATRGLVPQPEGAADAPVVLATPPTGQTGSLNVAGIPGISAGAGVAVGGSLLEKFRALPPGRRARVLVIGGLALFLVATLLEEPQAPKKKGKKPSVSASSVPVVAGAGAPGKPAAVLPSFSELTPDLQKFVDSQYNLSMEYYRNRDFDRSLYEVEKIFQYVSEYKDATDLKRYSIEGRQRVQAQEEERRRKEAERKVRERVTQLVLEIEGHMDRKEFDRAREYFAEVISIDPENQQIGEWKKVIQQYEDEQREIELRNRLIRETNERALQVIVDADSLRSEKKWVKAIEIYDSALALEPQEKKVIARAKVGIRKARDGLKAEMDPLIVEGRDLETRSEFAKAFAAYEKARLIDPRDKEAIEGLARVRGILTDQIKALYTEAVLAESYSDFVLAKAKFEQIVATAPKDDVYYERARRKLAKYVIQEEPKIE